MQPESKSPVEALERAESLARSAHAHLTDAAQALAFIASILKTTKLPGTAMGLSMSAGFAVSGDACFVDGYAQKTNALIAGIAELRGMVEATAPSWSIDLTPFVTNAQVPADEPTPAEISRITEPCARCGHGENAHQTPGMECVAKVGTDCGDDYCPCPSFMPREARSRLHEDLPEHIRVRVERGCRMDGRLCANCPHREGAHGPSGCDVTKDGGRTFCRCEAFVAPEESSSDPAPSTPEPAAPVTGTASQVRPHGDSSESATPAAGLSAAPPTCGVRNPFTSAADAVCNREPNHPGDHRAPWGRWLNTEGGSR